MKGENKFSLSEMAEILKAISMKDDANILSGNTSPLRSIKRIKIDLSEDRSSIAKAIKVSVPFRSVRVIGASDASVFVDIIPDTDNSDQEGYPITLKEDLIFDYKKSKCYITHPAQAGKFIELCFFLDAYVNTGSQVLDVNTSTSTASIAGIDMANEFPNVHLTASLSTASVTSVAQGESLCSSLVNQLGRNSIIDTSKAFVVPVGFELVLNSVEVFTITQTNVGQRIELNVGALVNAATNADVLIKKGVTASLISKIRAMRDSDTVLTRVLSVINSSLKMPNCFRLNLIADGDEQAVFSEGDVVAVCLENIDATAVTFECMVDIVGYLRRV
jgi:hypothetical protein